jgi:hypothetical protein
VIFIPPLWRGIQTIKTHRGQHISGTVTLLQTLFQKLEKLSAGTRRTPQTNIKQAVAAHIEYDECALERA